MEGGSDVTSRFLWLCPTCPCDLELRALLVIVLHYGEFSLSLGLLAPSWEMEAFGGTPGRRVLVIPCVSFPENLRLASKLYTRDTQGQFLMQRQRCHPTAWTRFHRCSGLPCFSPLAREMGNVPRACRLYLPLIREPFCVCAQGHSPEPRESQNPTGQENW